MDMETIVINGLASLTNLANLTNLVNLAKTENQIRARMPAEGLLIAISSLRLSMYPDKTQFSGFIEAFLPLPQNRAILNPYSKTKKQPFMPYEVETLSPASLNKILLVLEDIKLSSELHNRKNFLFYNTVDF